MRKIVVIDDDPAVRNSLKALLEKNGFAVTAAENGREGIHQVEAVGPDLVVTDIVMPEQDGIETVQVLRKSFPGTRIIAMSGGGSLRMNDVLEIATKLGANGRLEKPFTMETALSEIQRVLSL